MPTSIRKGMILLPVRLYKYGIHLTPGLAEVRSTLRAWPPFWRTFSGAGDFFGIPALKTS